MEGLNVITETEIVTNRDAWLRSQSDTQTLIQERQSEISELQKKLIALDGAIQAANIFLKIMNDTKPTNPTPSTE